MNNFEKVRSIFRREDPAGKADPAAAAISEMEMLLSAGSSAGKKDQQAGPADAGTGRALEGQGRRKTVPAGKGTRGLFVYVPQGNTLFPGRCVRI